MNTIEWTLKAVKQLRKIDRQYALSIRDGVAALITMPDCPQVKTLTNHGYGYRLRIGDFRVLFNWDDTIKIVEIEEIKKRDERTY